jgi:uncharacterized phage protein (TIGR02220 family)
MREYGKVGPKFWMGDTGKKLRKAGAEAQLVALYLMTSPHANMLGLYYVPVMYIAHETGLGIEGASKGLERAIEAGFCEYDEASEVVWVHEMATYQIAESLDPKDKRCIGIQNEYNALPANPFLARFFEKYKAAFNLTKQRKNASPSEAPSKGLRSQEQEQEQEQEKTTMSGKPDLLQAEEVLDYLNQVAGKGYRKVETNLKLIRAKLESGVTVGDCKAVIDAKVAEWGSKPEMEQYLRPETLFGARKFEQYLGQLTQTALVAPAESAAMADGATFIPGYGKCY